MPFPETPVMVSQAEARPPPDATIHHWRKVVHSHQEGDEAAGRCFGPPQSITKELPFWATFGEIKATPLRQAFVIDVVASQAFGTGLDILSSAFRLVASDNVDAHANV